MELRNKALRRKNDEEKILDSLYKGLKSPACFTSAEPLWREAVKQCPSITREAVNAYLHRQEAYTRHRRVVRNYERLATVAPGPYTVWQADLGVMNMLVKQNKGYAYYLLCIDCFTRKLFVEPLKDKTAGEVIEAFKKIFIKTRGHLPWRIITDQGKEFTSTSVQSFFKNHQIQHYCNYTSPKFHAGMAERANRTLKERLSRYFTEKGTKKWIDVIAHLVVAINRSPSRGLGGIAPDDVTFSNSASLRTLFNKRIQEKYNRQKQKNLLSVGQRVRIEKHKHVFEKGYQPNFTSEIFTIQRVRKESAPVTYALTDDTGQKIKGWFYRADLCPIYSRSGGKMWEIEKILDKVLKREEGGEFMLVKWKGLDDTYNSWIPSHSIRAAS